MYPSTISSNKYGLTLYRDNTSNTVKGGLNDIFLVRNNTNYTCHYLANRHITHKRFIIDQYAVMYGKWIN